MKRGLVAQFKILQLAVPRTARASFQDGAVTTTVRTSEKLWLTRLDTEIGALYYAMEPVPNWEPNAGFLGGKLW